MLACTALVGCTSEDEPVVNNGNQENGDAKVYMAVKFNISDAAGSRAVTNDPASYNTGSTAEQTINPTKSIFLFYDANNKYVTYGTVNQSTSTSHDQGGSVTNGTAIDIHNQAYIALSGPDGSIKNIKKVLTVINYNNVDALKMLPLSDALSAIAEDDMIAEGSTEPADATKDDPANGEDGNNGFLMTTSVYLDANNAVVNTTAIADGDFFDDQQEALTASNPVVIHVERAAAKVQVIADETYDVKDTEDETAASDAGDIHVDGALKTIKMNIDGWKLNNINPTTTIMKDISDWANGKDAPFTTPAWNETANWRSYWAKGTNWNMTAGNAVSASDANGNALKVYTYADADTDATNGGYEYCWEQTVATADADRGTANPNVTTVLIAAHFSFDGSSGDYFKHNGVYYSENTLKDIILKNMATKYYTKATAADGTVTYPGLSKEDLVIASNGTLAGITVTVKAKDGEGDNATDIQYYSDDKGTTVEQSVINTAIQNTGYVEGVVGYKGGACYYQIPIEHLSSTADKPFYGVVRNHWYKLNINEVKHIGEAVYNPDVLIPQIPPKNTEWYMAAEIHVLSWRMVEQSVTLD